MCSCDQGDQIHTVGSPLTHPKTVENGRPKQCLRNGNYLTECNPSGRRRLEQLGEFHGSPQHQSDQDSMAYARKDLQLQVLWRFAVEAKPWLLDLQFDLEAFSLGMRKLPWKFEEDLWSLRNPPDFFSPLSWARQCTRRQGKSCSELLVTWAWMWSQHMGVLGSLEILQGQPWEFVIWSSMAYQLLAQWERECRNLMQVIPWDFMGRAVRKTCLQVSREGGEVHFPALGSMAEAGGVLELQVLDGGRDWKHWIGKTVSLENHLSSFKLWDFWLGGAGACSGWWNRVLYGLGLKFS